MTDMSRAFMRPAQAAAHLGISRSTLYKYMERRNMPAKRIGKMRVIPVDDLALLFNDATQQETSGGPSGGLDQVAQNHTV